MRLLNVRTLEFSEYQRDVPKYVAASHRWNAGNEAMMGDVQTRRNTDKSGYKKVEGFAKYVREHIDHVDWLWIDTCCVNQDSSQEVTEAVNSMFRWYANAEVCLAYLADIGNVGDEQEFKQSKWFTRGWTLQELLAPHVVVFLSRGWKVIGHKGGGGWAKSGFEISKGPSLEPVVATITGVPECVLHNYHCSKSVSTDEKLAWIAGRDTTREEDMSYSLLGIFDLTMSVRYGEGAKNARRRLLRKISKASTSAWIPTADINNGEWLEFGGTTTRASLNIPFPQDPDFIDRGSLIDDIQQNLIQPTRRIALVGLGGVGKSQLAIEFAYRLREQSPNIWVFWIHASNVARFEKSVRDIADQVDLYRREDENADIFQLLRSWLRDKSHGEWVVIVDNADDAGFLVDVDTDRAKVSAPPLFECLPVCEHGSILITTRSRRAALQLVEDVDIIDVYPMEEEHAVVLLERKLGEYADITDIRDLVKALEFMPLAITQAAAYIRRRGRRSSVRQYLNEFQKSDEFMARLLVHDRSDLRRDRAATNSIILTWQISFMHIFDTRRSAANLLSLMSLCDRQAIPEFLIRTKGGEKSVKDDEFEDDIEMLLGFSFISVTLDGSTFEMHRLVQLATRKWLETRGSLEEQAHKLVDNLDLAFPSGDHTNWTVCQILFPHVRSALSFIPRDQVTVLQWAFVMQKAAQYASKKGGALLWTQAIEMGA